MSPQRKPRDVGNGLVCASFGDGGEWLSLAGIDAEAGFVEVTGLPLFDPALRGNREAVLRFRSWMRRSEHAFLRVEAGRAVVTTREEAPRGSRAVVQRVVLRALRRRDRPASISVRVSGRLAPPTLAQLHEGPAPADGGPPKGGPTTATSRVKAREGTLRINGPGGPVIVQVWMRRGDEGPAGSPEHRSDLRLSWQVLRRRMPTAVATADWPAGADEVHLDIACAFDRTPPAAPEWLAAAAPAPPPPAEPAPRPLRIPPRLVRAIGRLNQGAASYVRGCTALQVGPGERCLLSDHRILPLSRTREAYWQARLLLATWTRRTHRDDAAIVADHLRWLFLRCERPDGRWTRSHRADGARHDAAFQADQQLYPLLELLDHLAVVGTLPDLPPGPTWPELVAEAFAAAERGIDAESGLLATEEDATDQPAELRYKLADQVLLWHAATRLADAAALLGTSRAHLLELASRTRAAVDQHFTIADPRGGRWAGSADARGATDPRLDATDLPVALAPLWGFCRPVAPTWRATIGFAFDPANPSATQGPAGGLGSRALPGSWTLGDVMAWVAFGLMGDRTAAEAALERLVGAAFDDGMLPEAYDPDGSASVVRHWFAWPGAVLGSLVLEHAAREG